MVSAWLYFWWNLKQCKAVTREPITLSKIAWFHLFFMGGAAWRGFLIPKPPCRSPRPSIQKQSCSVSRVPLFMRLIIIIMRLLWFLRACHWYCQGSGIYCILPFLLLFCWLCDHCKLEFLYYRSYLFLGVLYLATEPFAAVAVNISSMANCLKCTVNPNSADFYPPVWDYQAKKNIPTLPMMQKHLSDPPHQVNAHAFDVTPSVLTQALC